MGYLQNKRLSWILVSGSMLSLFAFVSIWNINTYKGKRAQLKDDVATQLQLAYNEVKDSFITNEIVYFLSATLDDSTSISLDADSIKIDIVTNSNLDLNRKFPSRFGTGAAFSISIDSPSVRHVDSFGLSKDFTFNNINNNQNITKDSVDCTVFGSSAIKFEANNNSRFPQYKLITDTNNVTRWLSSDSIGDKIFPNDFFIQSENSTKNKSHSILNTVFRSSIDRDKMTYDQLALNLKKEGLPTQFDIVEDKTSSANGMRISYTSTNFGKSNWTIDLKNYQRTLIYQMFPTLFFSLLLLGMIGLAFFTLIKNWFQQQQLVNIKNDFINNMTHELKTPLATVGVALEAISTFDLQSQEVKAKEYVQISRHEINRLSLLVDKVLNMATLENKDAELNMEIVDLNEIVENILASMKLQIDKKQAQIQTNLIEVSPILADKVHLSNVVFNLLDNALKYGSAQPKIKIEISDNQDQIQFSIQDDGPGIPKEMQSKIFEKFYRIPNQDRHNVKGHGIGLSYAKGIIEQHGGNLIFESEPNQGSIFSFTLQKANYHA